MAGFLGDYCGHADLLDRIPFLLNSDRSIASQPWDLVALIGQESALWVASGLAGGFVLAAIVSRSMSSLIFGVDPFDVMSLTTSAFVLAAAAVIAAFIPIWRATRVDPITVLRTE